MDGAFGHRGAGVGLVRRYTVGWNDTITDLERSFERWGVESWQTLPQRPGRRTVGLEADERRVRVMWTLPDRRQVALACERWETPAENLRALYHVIDSMRLAEVRGVSELMASAYAQLGERAGGGGRAPHEVLGIAPDAGEEVRRAAWRALAKKHHPDVGGDPARFREITDAYQALRGQS